MDQKIVKYFTDKGFEVDWDCHESTGQSWYEFSHKGKLLCQIDMGIPLEVMLSDLTEYNTNVPQSNTEYDYIIASPENEFKQFLKILFT